MISRQIGILLGYWLPQRPGGDEWALDSGLPWMTGGKQLAPHSGPSIVDSRNKFLCRGVALVSPRVALDALPTRINRNNSSRDSRLISGSRCLTV